ncbi:response regulator [Candidatus Kaiserbacteria bacterium]|nr:response regulator [Candidatus Kaiserbacteria bacterium]
MEKKTILIVEDEQDLRDVLKTALVEVGFSVVAVTRGEEVLSTIQHERPDLIILDIVLPGVDGMTVLKKIRERGMRVPVIILTNLSSDENIMKGIIRDEPSYYLVKSDSPIGDIIEKVKISVGA